MTEFPKGQDYLVPHTDGTIRVMESMDKPYTIEADGKEHKATLMGKRLDTAPVDAPRGDNYYMDRTAAVHNEWLTDDQQHALAEELADDLRSPEVKEALGEFPIGTSMFVMRNERDAAGKVIPGGGYLEGDWKIQQVYSTDPEGRDITVIVRKDNLTKSATLDQLRSWQAAAAEYGLGKNVSPQQALGSVALESANEPEEDRPRTPAEAMAELTKGLSDTDVSALRGYAGAKQDKERAQKTGDGEGSTYAGQRMGSYLKDMSKRAQDVANRYAYWLNK